MAEERLDGYGVMGDILALWHCPNSPVGPPFTVIWHRHREAGCTVYTDIAPESVPAALQLDASRSVRDTIAVTWTGPRHLVVTVRDAGLIWSLELASTIGTRALSALVGRLPGWALGPGRMRLQGRTPGGSRYRLVPRSLWRVRSTRAAICGRDLGSWRCVDVFALGELWLEAGGRSPL